MSNEEKKLSAVDRLQQKANAKDAEAKKKQEEDAAAAGLQEVYIPLAKLRFDPNQPRDRFHTLDGKVLEDDLIYIKELAANIKALEAAGDGDGLINAITVNALDDGTFVVEKGECRSRAHILLGRDAIRAKVKKGIGKLKQRILSQLSENILRNDLKDHEVAAKVKQLMQDDDEGPAMKQTEIAATLGKTEGYLVRYVAFGDDELRKRWVETGIVDSAENLYRVKLLPEHLKLELLRRVELKEDHRDYLPKPLSRKVINDYSAIKQMEKAREKASKAPATPPAGKAQDANADLFKQTGQGDAIQTGQGADAPIVPSSNENDGGLVVQQESLDAALSAADKGSVPSAHASGGAESFAAHPGESYQLSEEDRAELLSGGEREAVVPVICKIPVVSLESLLPLLRTRPELIASMRNVICQVQLPSDLAHEIASILVGIVVSEQELPATIQEALMGLGRTGSN